MTNFEMIELHGLLHKMWTRDVGRDGYDKVDWRRFEELITHAARIASPCTRGAWVEHAQGGCPCAGKRA